MDKSPDAFRTISEVAEELDLPQHVLRFWETRFNQIRPMKRGGGRRYYRPDDVELLRGIRHLLYGEGYTIKGVQRILKEQGVRFVMDIWRHPGTPIPSGKGGEPVRGIAAALGRRPAPPAHDEHEEDDFPPEAVNVHPAPEPADEEAGSEALPAGILPEGAPPRGPFRFIDRLRGAGHPDGHHAPTGALSREDIRRLQSTLFELLECKRLLDQTR